MTLRRIASFTTLIFAIILLSINSVMAQDSSGISCVARKQTSEFGFTHTTVGNYAYVACSRGLSIIDLTNPAVPFECGFFLDNDLVRSVAVANNYAYLANGDAGVRVVDVSNPSSPFEVNRYDSPGYVYALAISATNLYLADGVNGLRILDITEPANPSELGVLATPYYALDVVVSGNFAYIADVDSGLRIVNIANPANCFEVGHYSRTAYQVQVQGNYAAIGGIDTVSILNIADPASPQLLAQRTRTMNQNGLLCQFAFHGNYFYYGSMHRGAYPTVDSRLQVLDLSNPDSIRNVGSLSSTFPFSICITGNHATVLNDQANLELIDLTSPANPLITSRFIPLRPSLQIQVTGNRLFNWFDYGCQIVNLDNSIPTRVTAEINNYIWAFSGEYGYSVDVVWNDSSDTRIDLKIYQFLANDSLGLLSQTTIWNCPFEIQDSPNSIFILDHYAVVGIGRYAGIEGIVTMNLIFDIANPSHPQRVGLFRSASSAIRPDCIIGETILESNESQIYKYSFANHDSTQLIGIDSLAGILSMVARDSIIFATTSDSTFNIFNASDIQNLRLIGCCHLPDCSEQFVIDGNYAYISDRTAGIRIIQIADLLEPIEVGFYEESIDVRSISVTNRYVYTSEYYNVGVYDCSGCVGVVDRIIATSPTTFALKPNYPNPFNPTTTIRYSIPKTSKVSLKIFDLTGREVANLVDFHQNPGEYSVKFDGSKLSSGTYFARLTAGAYSQTQKIVLLR